MSPGRFLQIALFFVLACSAEQQSAEPATDSETTLTKSIEQIESDWVTIQAGSFVYGSPESQPCRGKYDEKQVAVTLTRSFRMASSEVTRAQWIEMGFMDPSQEAPCEDCPVSIINWYEALAYANALSKAAGLPECYKLSECTGTLGAGCSSSPDFCNHLNETTIFECPDDIYNYVNRYECPGYRLPLVAEWEYAARAGTTTATYNGNLGAEGENECMSDDVLDPIAWYCHNSGEYPDNHAQIVKLKQPNAWGLYDMLGNIGEWVDHWARSLPLDNEEGKVPPLTDPLGVTSDEEMRNVRGNFYNFYSCYTTASRNFASPAETRGHVFGLRPVRTILDSSSTVWKM